MQGCGCGTCVSIITLAFLIGFALGVMDHRGGWEQFWEQFWFEHWHTTPQQREAKRRRESRETPAERWRKNGYDKGLTTGGVCAFGAFVLCMVFNEIVKDSEKKEEDEQ